MDNYFKECPPMMNDGRLFTDFRSSQVREEIFRYKNCTVNENETRTLRIDNGDEIADEQWDYLRATRSCQPQKKCFHKNPITRVTSSYNNAELLAYNGDLPAPNCDVECFDYRMTVTKGSRTGKANCSSANSNTNANANANANGYRGYPADRCPVRCAKTNRLVPEALYMMY